MPNCWSGALITIRAGLALAAAGSSEHSATRYLCPGCSSSGAAAFRNTGLGVAKVMPSTVSSVARTDTLPVSRWMRTNANAAPLTKTSSVLGDAQDPSGAALMTADRHGGWFPPPPHQGVRTPASPLIDRLLGTGSTPSLFSEFTYCCSSAEAPAWYWSEMKTVGELTPRGNCGTAGDHGSATTSAPRRPSM